LVLPVTKRYTLAAPAALNNFAALTSDEEPTESSFVLFQDNAINDIVNDPDPAAGLRYEFVMHKNGESTPLRAYSNAISPLTQGRVKVVGNLSKGKYAIKGAQRAGALTATSILVQFVQPLI